MLGGSDVNVIAAEAIDEGTHRALERDITWKIYLLQCRLMDASCVDIQSFFKYALNLTRDVHYFKRNALTLWLSVARRPLGKPKSRKDLFSELLCGHKNLPAQLFTTLPSRGLSF